MAKEALFIIRKILNKLKLSNSDKKLIESLENDEKIAFSDMIFYNNEIRSQIQSLEASSNPDKKELERLKQELSDQSKELNSLVSSGNSNTRIGTGGSQDESGYPFSCGHIEQGPTGNTEQKLNQRAVVNHSKHKYKSSKQKEEDLYVVEQQLEKAQESGKRGAIKFWKEQIENIRASRTLLPSSSTA